MSHRTHQMFPQIQTYQVQCYFGDTQTITSYSGLNGRTIIKFFKLQCDGDALTDH